MKLLFDQNLAASLVSQLADVFPGSIHVRGVGLSQAADDAVWEHAKAGGLMIVSKDSDFQEMSVLRGHPPKVVWIRRGNCSTTTIAGLLRENEKAIAQFSTDPDTAVLMLL